ncbi:MAG: 30S ribosomal protein S13 [Candidatus Aenigmatarchaeota archaeon]
MMGEKKELKHDKAFEDPSKQEKTGKKAEKEQKKEEKGKPKEEKRLRVLVRVLGADLDGEKSVGHAILDIKGMSHSFVKAICTAAKIDMNRKLGSFTESEIAELEAAIRDPAKFGLPGWVMNRRRDVETGATMHVSGPDVDMVRKFDVQRMIDAKTYKGVRHMLGLPVRGQRTRSSFRHNKAVGVVKKAARMAQAAAGAAAPAAKKAEEKK